MRIVRFAFTSALLLTALAATTLTTLAQSASGNYQFTLEDKATKYVEFSAQKLADGTTSGSMNFNANYFMSKNYFYNLYYINLQLPKIKKKNIIHYPRHH